jgi:hypothetical protein
MSKADLISLLGLYRMLIFNYTRIQVILGKIDGFFPSFSWHLPNKLYFFPLREALKLILLFPHYLDNPDYLPSHSYE